MEKYFNILQNIPLFKGISRTVLSQVLDCMKSKMQAFEKGQIILLAGSKIDNIGIVLSGAVQITKADLEGAQTLLAELKSGELFGEVFVCAHIKHSPVTVTAAENTEILFIDYGKAVTACSSACSFHTAIIENMLSLLAEKNLYLNQKLEILSKRTTRARLLLFLNQFGKGARQVEIPFNREELAQYLCAERSALSAEISKMQREGIIKCSGHSFTIL